MNRNISFMVFLVVISLAAVLLIGCGAEPVKEQPVTVTAEEQPTSEPTVAPEPAETEPAQSDVVEPQTVRYWSISGEPYEEEVANAFRTSYPDINLEYEVIAYDAYWDKLNAALESGVGPDAFMLPSPLVLEYVLREQLAPLPDSWVEELEQERLTWTITPLKIDGKYYGFPAGAGMRILLVNDDLLAEAGLEPESCPKDWNELSDYARKLTRRDADGNMTQAGLDMISQAYHLYGALMDQNIPGGPLLYTDGEIPKANYANEDGYETWEFINQLYNKDRVDDMMFIPDQYRFQIGKAAMMVSGFYQVAYVLSEEIPVNFHICPVPTPPDKPDSRGGRGDQWAYVVSASSENIKAAWDWVNYFASPESEKSISLSGYTMVTNKSLLNDPDLLAESFLAAGFDILPQIEAVPPGGGWDDIWYLHETVWEHIYLEAPEDTRPLVDELQKGADELYQEKYGEYYR
ncbi:MAG: extracellular solute-binding protein [Anaerolineales bacterium]|nr:extracellular solute-binding protein [Anaerolineales bacterium]